MCLATAQHLLLVPLLSAAVALLCFPATTNQADFPHHTLLPASEPEPLKQLAKFSLLSFEIAGLKYFVATTGKLSNSEIH